MSSENFKVARIVKSYTQRIESEPETIFPLLCPEMEKLWLHGWDYKMIFSESGKAEKDCIFSTKTNEENDTIWVNSIRDDDKNLVEFVIFTPGLRVTCLKIQIIPNDGFSNVEITYSSISLSDDGNRFLNEYFADEEFARRMKWWEKSMNYYILEGKIYTGEV